MLHSYLVRRSFAVCFAGYKCWYSPQGEKTWPRSWCWCMRTVRTDLRVRRWAALSPLPSLMSSSFAMDFHDGVLMIATRTGAWSTRYASTTSFCQITPLSLQIATSVYSPPHPIDVQLWTHYVSASFWQTPLMPPLQFILLHINSLCGWRIKIKSATWQYS